MVHYKFYRDIDGHFQLEDEAYIEYEVNFDTDAYRTVLRDKNGDRTNESRFVDGVAYFQFVIDRKLTAWFADTPTATLPLRKGRRQVPGTICGNPMSMFTVAMDHGIEVLNGVDVRHVSLFSNESQIDPTRYHGGFGLKVEFWVDSSGQLVQVRQEDERPEVKNSIDGKPGGTKDESQWTFEIVPPIDILPPETFEKWTGELFPDSNQ